MIFIKSIFPISVCVFTVSLFQIIHKQIDKYRTIDRYLGTILMVVLRYASIFKRYTLLSIVIF